MYKILIVEDKVRVPPNKFTMKLREAVKSSLQDRWEGIIDRRLGVILSVIAVDKVGDGKILPGDGALHYPVDFRLLVYYPEMHEIVSGHVIDITEFGAFVRMGPVDGMIHVSQIMDDYVSYDVKNSIFAGRDSKRILKEGDIVRARVISVSMGGQQYKIGLTSRQPGLGELAWVEKEKRGETVRAERKAPEERHAKRRKGPRRDR